MANKTMTISVPENIAQYIEGAVKTGDYASTSDFIRILIREHQKISGESWIESLIKERRATAHPENLVSQDDLEQEILGRSSN